MAKKKTKKSNSGSLIECAFCEGAGTDPFGIMSSLSKCQVCGGKGKVHVEKPVIKCAFCAGTGKVPDKRITCTACMGKGVVKAVKNPTVCPGCDGTGTSRSTPGLPCIECKGAGVV